METIESPFFLHIFLCRKKRGLGNYFGTVGKFGAWDYVVGMSNPRSGVDVIRYDK